MDPRVAAILARGGDAPAPPRPAPTSGMDFVVDRVMLEKPEHQSEISRICALPIVEPLANDEIDAINGLHVKPEAAAEGFRLQRVQAEAIHVYSEVGSVFAPIEVGGGKTLICLRCIGIAFESGANRVALFVPSQVYNQLVNHDIGWARQRVPLGCTFFLMGGKTPARRRELAGGRRGCWIIPYSLLSRPDTSDLLDMIRPEHMIFDEAHALKNRDSARTKRIWNHWMRHRPRCSFTSGTMTAKSLRDYAHLLTMCLGQGAPVPAAANVVQEWAATLDSEQAQAQAQPMFQSKGTQRTSAGPLRPLINWSNLHFPKTQLPFDTQGFRMAFQNRLLTTPGVVSSPADALGVSIYIENRKADQMAHEGGALLLEITRRLVEAWVTPSGDELEHAMQVWGWQNQLTAGIYYAQVWPDAGHVATKRGLHVDEAERLMLRSKDHHKALQEYHRELRSWFSHHGWKAGLDTPMLVGADMARHGAKNVGAHLFDSWSHKNSLDFEGRVDRESVPTRVCPFKIIEAIEWSVDQGEEGGIVWFYHNELGEWALELFQAAGLPVVYCPAGNAANAFLTDEGAADRCKGKIILASMKAHGTGKNLQFMRNQCFMQLPITELDFEQNIGRTHRKGQIADEVVISTMISNDFDQMALAAILNDALYVRETFNSPRKVLVATWDPMPTVYGSQVLIRAGAQAKMLTARQQQLLSDKFSVLETK